MAQKSRILFLCAENSCRSQMAEGFMRALAGEDWQVFSAGTIATQVNPRAIQVMAEIEIDIAGHGSKSVNLFEDQTFDVVVTVCEDTATKHCPIFNGQTGRRLHWPFRDPGAATGSEDEILGVFRDVRDQIRRQLVEFAGKGQTDNRLGDTASGPIVGGRSGIHIEPN